ncbi:TetR/AcrR family transcriptional regulator [Cellulomonas palmilytica]|uniref:TetR/AcrR family transcriptional regulator n=1 Tax=Cellulomonas palmilytica TaxID=2608402 RepID=UPI001F441588|nr:TetR/AcrR family transcriptional regulator [Cellulomonas palmilytica]UJP40063.1 TetR/AcrR family transcriptional regulator [Cellulomonas palmilytica]
MVKASTTKQAWLDAAYDTFRRDGLAAVRVEPLARSLGATKGSFYWHFADRAELVAAVVARWEDEHTDAVIALAQTGGDARARLEALFAAVARLRRESARLYVEAAVEGVGDVVARVSQRRVDYLADLLVELGHDPDEARRRSLVALASVVGLGQLAAVGVRPDDPDAFTRSALAMTLS